MNSGVLHLQHDAHHLHQAGRNHQNVRGDHLCNLLGETGVLALSYFFVFSFFEFHVISCQDSYYAFDCL